MKIEKKREATEQCISGLIHYAIERQIGFESHQQNGIPLNPAARNERTRRLICGMEKLYGLDTENHVGHFDEQLRSAQGSFGVEPLSKSDQYKTVQGLLRFTMDLAEQHQDNRDQMMLVSDHFEDMAAYLPWDASGSGLYPARDWLDQELPAITAQQNILFTRILLGAEQGPAASDFDSGAITDPAGVADTCLFSDLSAENPEIGEWTALCTVYRGGYGHGEAKSATKFDLDIMRRYGDSFVELEGVSVCRYPIEITVSKEQAQEQTGMNGMNMT